MVRKLFAYTSGSAFSEALSSITDTFFLIHCTVKLESAFYKKVKKNDVWLKVKTSVKLLGLGKSTLLFQMAVRDMSDDELLASSLVKLTKVDSIVRRSSNFPDSFTKKFAELLKTGTSQLPMFRPLKAPYNGFSHQFVIRPSDTDSNGHTTNYVYTELCLDCAHLAATKHDYFKRFTGDFDQPKMVERYFAKECGEGDTVKVVVWEDGDSTTVLHFQIEKDNVLLFHANFDFYSENHTLSKL